MFLFSKKPVVTMLLIFLFLGACNSLANSKDSKETHASVNFYFDSREYLTINIMTSTRGLPFGFTIWGFTDLHGNQNPQDGSLDLTRYFMEYRLSHQLHLLGINGIGAQLEYNDFNAAGNQVFRLGATLKHGFSFAREWKGWLQWRFFPIETDESGQQVSVIYFVPIMNEIFISGFADLNMNGNDSDRWVIEPQLNFKFSERFTGLLEFRYNGFEADNRSLRSKGVALGLGIVF